MSSASSHPDVDQAIMPSQHAELIVDGVIFERSTIRTSGELFVSVWAYHLEFLHQLRTIAVHQS